MKPSKKIQRKLERRQNGHKKIHADGLRNARFDPRAWRVPGSRNPKK